MHKVKNGKGQIDSLLDVFGSFPMLYGDWLLLEYFIDVWVHHIAKNGRNEGHIETLDEVEGKSGHTVGELKGGKDFVGVHVVVGVPLEPENQPIVDNIQLAVPRRNLVDLLLILVLAVDQSIVLNVLNTLH